jgi:chromosomal replication initiator protein
MTSLWTDCLRQLQADLSETDFNTWIRPLQAVEDSETLRLLAPNRFVVDWVSSRCLGKIREVVARDATTDPPEVVLQIGSRDPTPVSAGTRTVPGETPRRSAPPGGRFNGNYTFDRFVEGKSNQLARAAAIQVSRNPGGAYNPLFI